MVTIGCYNIKLPAHIQDFIAELVSLQPQPTSVWLIGSQANGRATEQSDTDLLVFGSPELLEVAASRLRQPEKVDCLIVYDLDNYQDPWQEKKGALSKLKWQQVNDYTANYIGTKWVPDEESSLKFGADMGDLVERQERAVRVWP